jgi:hypothetical protein
MQASHHSILPDQITILAVRTSPSELSSSVFFSPDFNPLASANSSRFRTSTPLLLAPSPLDDMLHHNIKRLIRLHRSIDFCQTNLPLRSSNGTLELTPAVLIFIISNSDASAALRRKHETYQDKNQGSKLLTICIYQNSGRYLLSFVSDLNNSKNFGI